MNKEQELRAWLKEYEEKTQYSGALQIISKGTVIFSAHTGFADRGARLPITESTKFRFYSITKAFVAIAVMKLYDEGAVDLDAHPGTYLDCAAHLDARLTIRHLLQHNSGLVELASLETMQFLEAVDLSSLVEELAKKELLFAPGTGCEYRNTNFIILSLIVEHFRGMEIFAYLETELFPALGMQSACCDTGEGKVRNLAVGYSKIGDEILPADAVNMRLISGAGCGAGCVSDVEALYHLYKNRSYLTPSSWEMVLTPSPVGGFGFGCSVFSWHGHLCYQNNGGHMGFRTLHRYLPDEDFDIILLSNAGFGDARTEICEQIYQLYFHAPVQKLLQPEMDRGFV